MTTPILGIPEITSAQVNQYAVVNEAIRSLEAAGNDFATVDLTSGNVTLTAAQLAADLLFRTSGNAVARDLTVPAAKRLFVVHNNGAATLSVKCGSTTVSVASTIVALLYADGTTNGLILVSSTASSSSFTGGTLTSALNEAPIVTLASAATADLGAQSANTISVTGTTTITALGTIASGALRRVAFTGALTLTHNATSLILPTGANITTAAGDVAEFVSLGAGNWRCTGYQRASGAALSSSGGGLTNFTDAISTAAPNATTPAASLTATNAATNVDGVFAAKGGGATLAQVPDSATAGGNKRGQYSTDLQKFRSNADRVASGSYSFIGAGSDCRASGGSSVAVGGNNCQATADYSAVVGGATNTASGIRAFIGAGETNTASGTYSAVDGGQNNTASGAHSVVDGGYLNTADAQYSSVHGGAYATARGIIGAEARGNGRFSANGDAQRRRVTLRRSTTDATVTAVTSDAAAAGTTNQAILPNTSAFMFTALVVARSSADSAAYQITGLITRGANAASTALVGTPTVTVIAESGGAAAWDAAAVADTTNGGLQIQVTGAAATSIKWVVDLETVEVVG